LVRKRKVLVLKGQFRPKRPKNGLYQGHTARANAGNSTSEAFVNPGGLPRPCAHLFKKRFLSLLSNLGPRLGRSTLARPRATCSLAPAPARARARKRTHVRCAYLTYTINDIQLYAARRALRYSIRAPRKDILTKGAGFARAHTRLSRAKHSAGRSAPSRRSDRLPCARFFRCGTLLAP
jgi:hypothetical protein